MNKGFTLLELAIVITIIGLILGGVVFGQSMIRQTELKSVSKQVGAIGVALNTFMMKYQQLPGDLTTASQYFGSCTDDGVVNTCNGNGNGILGKPAGGSTFDVNMKEIFRAWEHLTYAGLFPGNFTGKLVSNQCRIGVNVPESVLKNAVLTFDHRSASIQEFPNSAAVLQLGAGDRVSPDACGDGAALTPQEAWQLDSKMDDGVADAGRVHGQNSNVVTGCVTGSDYIMTNTDPRCRMYFRLR